MYLVIRKADSKIMLSSVRPLNEAQYEESGMYVAEIPDDQYDPKMVGGFLNDQEVE